MSRLGFAAILLAFSALPLSAGVRITYDIQGAPTPIAWAPSSFPLQYQIDQRAASLTGDAKALIDRAFDSWARVPDAKVSFQSGGVVAAVSTRQDERVTVSVADDLLAGQGAVAMTFYTYDTTTGRMLDADIRIDPSLFEGRVNAEMALEHEIGHLLGLDHSGVISSIMYPYVGAAGTPADFDSDDLIAISSVYPRTDPTLRGATLQGRVTGDRGGIFAAQVVAVNSQGQPVSTVLTNAAGEFSMVGLPAGRYQLYAEPLDGPVLPASLQGTWRTAGSSFATQFYGEALTVESGRVYGNIMLATVGSTGLNPRAVGGSAAEETGINLSTTPVNLRAGQRMRLSVGGDGFVSGMTEFDVLNPAVRRVSDYDWWDGSVAATFEVAPTATESSAVILVRSGRESATLTGALRIRSTAGTPARTRAVRR